MELIPTIKSMITGTSAMTLFSYLISEKRDQNFREPLVLADLIARFSPKIQKSDAALEGWALHYLAGFGFSYLYDRLWKSGKVKPTVFSGMLLGAASGVTGILVWKTVFKLHPNPPAKNLKKYFGHLMLAHIVFGAFSSLGYRSEVKQKESIT
jgi:hypothetical protein